MRRRFLMVVFAFTACASVACGKKADSPLVKFDAGLPGARDADAPDAPETIEDATTGTIADASTRDANAPDAIIADAGEDAGEDAGAPEAGAPDAEEAETGIRDAERDESGFYEDAEAGVDDTGMIELDAGNDAGIVYDATVCTGAITVRGPCTDCAEGLCCTELAACNGNLACVNEFQNCLVPCVQTQLVSTCMAQCLFSPDGVALRNCVTNQCSAVCP